MLGRFEISWTVAILLAGTVVTGCGGDDKASDLLAAVQDRGVLRVSTDPNYAPQSMQLGDGTFEGFDVDVAKEIAMRLGVTVEFATPDWEEITAGNWNDAWDVSVGSMTITQSREEVLRFARPPYYFTPAVFAVASDAGITDLAGLADQTICVGTETTYEEWLSGSIGLPASSIYVADPPTGVTVVTRTTDQECFDEIEAGTATFVAVLTSETVVDEAIARGVGAVKIDQAVFSEELAVAVDKGTSLDSVPLVERIGSIVEAMHTDGTLTGLSNTWFGADLTQDPNS